MNLLQAITPTNLQQERDKFFASKTYNPQFNYIWCDGGFTISKTDSIKQKLIAAIVKQDVSEITSIAQSYFGVHNWEYAELASSVVANKPNVQFDDNVDTLVDEFKAAFRFFNLDYQVKIVDEQGFNVRPKFKAKEIVVSKHLNFQFFDSIGEVKHELVHVLRYENGVFNNIAKSSNYLPTEEGLATFMHDASINGSASKFQHAAEYLASMTGLTGSLRDIYNFFVEIGFTPDLAWQRACRHKFGHVDTSLPGDIIKPAMYFAYAQKVAALSSEDKLKLFVGKVSIADLPNIQKYSGILTKEQLAQFYNL